MAISGVLVLDKPAGLSSAIAADKAKRELGAARAGHGGTLDPMATGVLVVCLGDATKIAGYLLAEDKAYEAEGTLGAETDTYDRTGQVTAQADYAHVTREAIERALAVRVGVHPQVPPAYSAVKRGGERAYKRARAGDPLPLVAREVRIDRLELLAFEPPRFRFAMACGKGTYVRSLIFDVGRDLGCGAHMSSLCRVRSGAFEIADAQQLGALDPVRLIAMPDALGLPRVVAPRELVPKIASGVQLPPAILAISDEIAERFQIVTESDGLVAVAHIAAGKVVYDRVFLGHEARESPLT